MRSEFLLARACNSNWSYFCFFIKKKEKGERQFKSRTVRNGMRVISTSRGTRRRNAGWKFYEARSTIESNFRHLQIRNMG